MITQYRIYTSDAQFTAYTTAEFVELAQTSEPTALLKSLYAVGVAKFTDASLTHLFDEKTYLFRNAEKYSTSNFFLGTDLVRMASFLGDAEIHQQATQSLREIFLTMYTMDKGALMTAADKGIGILLGMDAQRQSYSGIQNLCYFMCALFFCEEDEPTHIDLKQQKNKTAHWKQYEPALAAFFLPIGYTLTVKYGAELDKTALVLMTILEQVEANMIRPTETTDQDISTR